DCLDCRPDDPAVWSAIQRWAMAAQDLPEAQRAMARLPAERMTEPERWSLRAWLAARSNQPDGERSALEQLIVVDPRNTPALDRLAALALQAGQADRAAALRRLQVERLSDKHRYRRLMIEDRSPIPLEELRERVRLAERLGRWFEARGWLTLTLERDPGDAL